MGWENLLKRDIYEGDPDSDRFKNKSARKTYDWFMATMGGNEHPAGDVHDSNLLYVFMGHVKKAFGRDKSSREYRIADTVIKSMQENEQLTQELYELISSNIAPEDRQLE